MDRRRFLIASTAGGAWFVGLLTLYNKYGDTRVSSRIRVEEYLHLGERAALEAITSNADFYTTSQGLTPRVKADEWRLVVDGLVENPVTLTLPQVKALPPLERTLTLECIENRVGGPAIGNARWRGTALRPLLESARPPQGSAVGHAPRRRRLCHWYSPGTASSGTTIFWPTR